MGTVMDKFRGSVPYHQLFTELVTAARYRGTVTYQELAQVLGLPLSGGHMAGVLRQVLGVIAQDEYAQQRPLLSAVAVGVNVFPDASFFSLAQDLGELARDADAQAQRAFWKAQRAKAYETWKRPLRKEA